MAGECCAGLADLGRRRLDELRDVAVPLASAGAWLKVVRDVPDEDVLERPLLVSLDPGHRVPADQVASLERGEGRAEGVRVSRDALEAPRQKIRPAIEASRMTSRSSTGKASRRAATRPRIVVGRLSASSPPSLKDCGELLDEERVPLAGPRHLGRLRVGAEEMERELRRRRRRPAAREEGRCRRACRRPTRAAGRAAPAGRASGAGRAGRAGARPGARSGRGAQGRPSGCPRRRTPSPRLALPLRRRPGRTGRGCRDRGWSPSSRSRAGSRCARRRPRPPPCRRAAPRGVRSFSVATVDVVAVEDAGELLHLHREGAVRAALAIRQAAAADDATAAGRDALRELGREPRLADARTRRAP